MVCSESSPYSSTRSASEPISSAVSPLSSTLARTIFTRSSISISHSVQVKEDALGADGHHPVLRHDPADLLERFALPQLADRLVVQVADHELREELAGADRAVGVHLHPVRDREALAAV